MNGTINELKQGLLKCANENEDRTYLTGQVIISSICKDAKDTIEELEKENEQLQQKWLDSEYEKAKLVSQIEKTKSNYVELDEESIQGLLAILAIFTDRISELENLERTDLRSLYSIAKPIQKDIGCKICVHYGKERDCRGCTTCCNGSCCNLEVKKNNCIQLEITKSNTESNDGSKLFEQEKCELLGIIQQKDELIEKMKCCFNCDKPIKHLDCGDCNNGSNWELASERLIRSWQDEN